VTVEPAEVLPGAQVTVRYDIGGELDDKCTGLTVGLQGAAKYGDMQYQSSYDNKTGSYEEVTVS